MRVAVFSTKPYDERFLSQANAQHSHDLHFFESRLTYKTASLAAMCPAVCVFVNDVLDERVLRYLEQEGVRLIALRCAGFNNVNLEAAFKLEMSVVRVPAYSPYAVAEHAMGLILGLNRHLHRAYNRVREGNFALDGLLGFDLNGRTMGIVGTGKIGLIMARIAGGFGCQILAYDLYPNPALEALGGRYVTLDELLAQSDIVSLHCPLTPESYHLIGETTLPRMKRGAMLINTSRGALIDTAAVTEALKNGQLGALGLDVYEEEADLFFEDLSSKVIQDDTFARLLTFPNVIITGHQAFFTEDALRNIAETTIQNINEFEQGIPCANAITGNSIKK